MTEPFEVPLAPGLAEVVFPGPIRLQLFGGRRGKTTEAGRMKMDDRFSAVDNGNDNRGGGAQRPRAVTLGPCVISDLP